MPVAPGTKLGPYEILSPLGAGGMGEVYRARDSRLGRDVAIKAIPQAFAADAERMARFQREAQVLASLSHPHIATIHGLEESGSTRALVMELVEGPTIAGRIAAGPIALEEALPIARQIAEALEYAHDRGIIHRDLKPANVKVTPEGTVKVLDFGLAKALDDAPASVDISTSPTLTAAATKAGIILGTAAYMSPEQAKGKPVDRRSDIWSFGVVLYEMLTGKSLYTGETASETLAAVIMKETDLAALPGGTPAPIRHLLRRCLEKDPKRRLQAIGEARIVIEQYLTDPKSATAALPVAATSVVVPPLQRALPWAGAALFALTTVLAFWRPWQAPPAPPSVVRVSAELGADVNLFTPFGSSAILSPDGTRLAFVARGSDQKQRVYVRSLDQLQASPLSGTEGARNPFFAPDGQWIAFFADGKLKKISVQGGAAVTLCDAPDDRGGDWGEDDNVIFTPNARAPLLKVSSAGGTPEPLTALDKQAGEVTHRWPQVLPGAKAVLFTASTNGTDYEDSNIVVQALPAGQRKTVARGGFQARYLPSGHLVYLHEGTLFAIPFDLKRLETTGQPAPVIESVVNNSGTGGAQFSFSETGTFAYVAGRGVLQNVSILWMDREGKFTPLRVTPADYYNPVFSPDGKRLAVQIWEGKRADVWVYDWARDTLTRLTFAGETNQSPVWTPDGQRIAYQSREKSGSYSISWKRADGAGDAQRLTESKNNQYPEAWRPDGRTLALIQSNPDTSWDIYTLTMEGDEKSGWKPGEPKPFLNTPSAEFAATFSPDGRWLAYMCNESGTFEVYVRPFPGPGGKWQISTGGGIQAIWSRNGKELFYRTAENKIMVVTYTASGDSFRADKPKLWSPGQFTERGPTGNYALHPDGKRFAVLKAPGAETQASANKVVLLFNFFDELRRKLPAKR